MSLFHRLDSQKASSFAAYAFAVGSILFLLATGCGTGRATTDYVPATDQARQAVELVLEGWKSGTISESMQLPNNGSRVQAFDKQRASGKKLSRYEVVSELPAEPNRPRQFAVKLGFEGDKTETETSYYVVGIDPLLVFRDTEYTQASGGVLK